MALLKNFEDINGTILRQLKSIISQINKNKLLNYNLKIFGECNIVISEHEWSVNRKLQTYLVAWTRIKLIVSIAY